MKLSLDLTENIQYPKPKAAQLAEVYWMALTRDVPFSKYGVNEETIAAAGNPFPRLRAPP